MLAYLVKRVLAMIPTLLGITFLTFLIITCAPGDPVAMQISGGAETGESQARKADAIRAKRKLLGMMEADHAVRAWRLPGPDAAAERPGAGATALRTAPSPGEFDAWPRSLAPDLARGLLYAGTIDGGIRALAVGAEDTPAFAPERFERPASAGGTEGSPVLALAVSPDGATVAATDATGRLRLLRAADGGTVAEWKGIGRSLRDLAYLPSGEGIVAAFDDGTIRVHDAKTAEERKVLARQSLFVAAVEPSKDGRSVFALGYDRKVRRIALSDGAAAEVGEIPAAGYALALSADGTRLAAAGDDRGVTVFDVSEERVPAPVSASMPGSHGRTVSALAFSGDGRTLVSASKDGGLRVWRMPGGEPVAQAPDNTNGEVFAAAFASDGTSLWTASQSDRPTPVWKRYLTWLGKLVTLDFDRSFVDGEPVIEKLADALPITLGLSALTIFITYLVSIPVGVIAAVRRGQAFDRVTSLTVFLLWSIPSFFAATLLIQRFSSQSHLDLFPSYGLTSPRYADLTYVEKLLDHGSHLVLPMVTFVYGTFAAITQYMRTSMLDSISQDYVRTARAKGLSERIVIFRHALRNSLVTMVTLVATLLPAMIGGSVIVERIFSIRGMGYLGFTAITERDYPVIMAVTTMGAVLTLLGMLLSDVLYAIVDPRIAHE